MHSQTQQPQDRWRYAKSFLSGGIAGAVSKTIIAPIERVKFLFIDFSVFDFLRGRFYKKDGSVKQKLILFLCGAGAGLSALTVTTPLEFIRVRLAMERDKFTYKNNTSAIRIIVAKEGFLGFYKGYMAAVCGIIIYHGCSFFIFTRLKEQVKKISPHLHSKWYIDFLLGGISAIGQLIAYPFDILRKRMQGQALLHAKKQIERIINYRELIKLIYKDEGGVFGFYKGVSLNMIKAPTASATAWTVKNYLNRALDKNYDF